VPLPNSLLKDSQQLSAASYQPVHFKNRLLQPTQGKKLQAEG
jgi:hypothetical protein